MSRAELEKARESFAAAVSRGWEPFIEMGGVETQVLPATWDTMSDMLVEPDAGYLNFFVIWKRGEERFEREVTMWKIQREEMV